LPLATTAPPKTQVKTALGLLSEKYQIKEEERFMDIWKSDNRSGKLGSFFVSITIFLPALFCLFLSLIKNQLTSLDVSTLIGLLLIVFIPIVNPIILVVLHLRRCIYVRKTSFRISLAAVILSTVLTLISVWIVNVFVGVGLAKSFSFGIDPESEMILELALFSWFCIILIGHYISTAMLKSMRASDMRSVKTEEPAESETLP